MSTIQDLLKESQDITPCNRRFDIVGKFRAYRLVAESTEIKLKDANEVIERLKDEINFSRESEKNLRNQLSSTQTRLICLQQTLKKLIIVSERSRQSEKVSQQIEQKVEKIRQEINQTREESQNLLKYFLKECDLLGEIKRIKSVLEMKNNEQELMQMEIQTLTIEKKNMETENQKKLKNLKLEVEKLKKKEVDAETSYRETLLACKQQLEEKEHKIRFYERERKSFLEDFEPSKLYEISPNNFTCTDSTVSFNAPERSFKASDFQQNKTQIEPEESHSNVLYCSSSRNKSKLINRRKGNFSLMLKKHKLQLEFLVQSQNSSPTVSSAGLSRKRRLFSTNCNHYTDHQI